MVFPHGYRLSEDDAECRRDVLRLLAVLCRFAKKQDGESLNAHGSSLNNLPLLSYQYVILDYYANGYYKEREVRYTSAPRGKINWARTIQQERAMLDGMNPVFLSFQVTQSQPNEHSLLAIIHRYCVHESFRLFGWLFVSSDYLPQKPSFPFNKPLFIATLQHALNNTFNDSKRRLLAAMLNIIRGSTEAADVQNQSLGVNHFAPVWEQLVDYVFGIENKRDFFPHARWHILRDERKHIYQTRALEPDTIMEHEGKLYVLDAKYYQYGITGDPADLPHTDSIQKQITYGQYIWERQDCSEVYNAFIMPYDGREGKTKFVCVASADWLDYNDAARKSHEYVLGILMDTKWLISKYARQNETEITNLADMIEQSLANCRHSIHPPKSS